MPTTRKSKHASIIKHKSAAHAAPAKKSRGAPAAAKRGAAPMKVTAVSRAAPAAASHKPVAGKPALKHPAAAKVAVIVPVKGGANLKSHLTPPVGKAAVSGKKGAAVVALSERRISVVPEDRQSQLKLLIARGKEQGYLTYAQVNDHLPPEIVDPEQIEDIVNTINDMGIPVYEKVPDSQSLLASDPASPADEEAIEEAAAATATGRARAAISSLARSRSALRWSSSTTSGLAPSRSVYQG